jgi:serine/threonine protein kinase
MLTKQGGLRPLDFEGACRLKHPDPLPWGTEHFVAPEASEFSKMASRLPEDLYALGAVIYFLFSGRPPDPSDPMPLWILRRNIPSETCSLVMDLLDPSPKRRPSARIAARSLARLCNWASLPHSPASSTRQIGDHRAAHRR